MTRTILPASVDINMAKILLIDDDQNLVDIFKTALENAGHTIITAPDGKTGLEKVESDSPDLVLLDQMLPDSKGQDILKTLKTGAHKDVKVAILSNFGQNELIQEALNLGAAEYILKYQIAPVDLVAKVKQLVG